jgi:predicted alpha/beta hydrolase
MKVSIAVLIASLLIAIGSWGSGFSNWQQLKEISNVFSLLGVIGSVVLAWMGRSPITPKQ